ncbi:HalOD1 output domain-containing protein [Haloarchaeobius salinus]|uniref:HalOD1 output domain-containing protein n=1 Tax=Haloarchaeobius salinus TaxID=1198298 RepID=UPI0021090E93|nr:HalOD1 output domain-containing protein [Haloarchaeobius salinus]
MAASDDGTYPEPVARVAHDFSIGESVSTTVATALGRAAGRDPARIRPLYDHIDTDALDALVAHGIENGCGHCVSVDFSVDEFDVCVRGDGEVSVYEPF